MEQKKTKLVEEENTIYEIDLDCMRKKELERQRKSKKKGSRNQQEDRIFLEIQEILCYDKKQ